jgi:hypothetical protein
LHTLGAKRPPSSLVIHLKGVDIFTASAAAVYGPRTSPNLYVLSVAFVGHQERSYGGFLVARSYDMMVTHDGGLSSASGYYRRGEVLSGR